MAEPPLAQARRRGIPFASAKAGRTTLSLNISPAISTVASCRSCLDPKCAKRPSLLIFNSLASRPIVSPSRPSKEVRFCATLLRLRINASLLRGLVAVKSMGAVLDLRDHSPRLRMDTGTPQSLVTKLDERIVTCEGAFNRQDDAAICDCLDPEVVVFGEGWSSGGGRMS